MPETTNSNAAAEAAGRRDSFAVLGLGGAGLNVLDRLVVDGPEGGGRGAGSAGLGEVGLIAFDTDSQALAASVAPTKVQLGRDVARGLGAGGDPEVGYDAAAEAADAIREVVAEGGLAFLCLGLGGGTGSGAGPTLAAIARQSGAFVIAFATMPFAFEGRRRRQQAELALAMLREHAAIVVCFENDRMGDRVAPAAGIHQAFAAADQIIGQSIRAIARMLRQRGLMRIGLADLAAAVGDGGCPCLFGFGEAVGGNRIHDALARALKSPLLEKGRSLADARTAIVHVTGGPSLTLDEVETLMRELNRHLADDCQTLFGAGVDPEMGDRVAVAILGAMADAGVARAAAAPVDCARPLVGPTAAAGEPPPARRVAAVDSADVGDGQEEGALPSAEEPLADGPPPVATPVVTPVATPVAAMLGVEPVPAVAPVAPSAAVAGPAVKAEPAGPARRGRGRRDVGDLFEAPAAGEGGAAGRPGRPGRVERQAAADEPRRQQPPPSPAAREERQGQLEFEPLSRGRFEKSEPTIIDGEDLDVPTFMRANVKVRG